MISNWLARHPRFHLHFTPTGSSWVNQIERFFGLITDKRNPRLPSKIFAADLRRSTLGVGKNEAELGGVGVGEVEASAAGFGD